MLDRIQSEQEHNAALEAGIAQAAKPNYLGDIQVIEFLLRDFARHALARRNPPEDSRPNTEKDGQDALRLASIFLGQDPQYAPIPGWNEPGQIDVWIAQELNVQDDTPQLVVASAFARFLTEIYTLYSYACEPDTKPEQWEWQVDAICEQWRNVLLGVKEPTVTEDDILDRQDA